MKKTRVCPKCGSKEVKGPDLQDIDQPGKLSNREISSYFCIECGYIEYYAQVFQ